MSHVKLKQKQAKDNAVLKTPLLKNNTDVGGTAPPAHGRKTGDIYVGQARRRQISQLLDGPLVRRSESGWTPRNSN